METRPRIHHRNELLEPTEPFVSTQSVARRLLDRFMRQSRGAIALNVALCIVTGYAIAALIGIVTPVTAFVVGLGAQVVGTIAFFLTYFMGRRD